MSQADDYSAVFIPSLLHVLFTPIWMLLRGQADQVWMAMVSQLIAVPSLSFGSIVSITPFLILLAKTDLSVFNHKILWATGLLSAIFASYSLGQASVFSTWSFALLSSMSFFVLINKDKLKNKQ